MKLAYFAVSFCGIILSNQHSGGQFPPGGLPPEVNPPSGGDDSLAAPDVLPPGINPPGGGDDSLVPPETLPPGINPPGEGPLLPSGAGRPCCDSLPVVIPPPELPLPICPGALPPVFGSDGGLIYCLPSNDDCPTNSACWYNGINYYCCPMDVQPNYGQATPAPPTNYGGAGPPSERPRPPGGRNPHRGVKPPGTLPQGIKPPGSDSSGGASVPSSLPNGVSPPSGANNTLNAPGPLPNGVNPPSDESSEEAVEPPGNLPLGVNPPSGHIRTPVRNQKRIKPVKPIFPTGPQPPPFIYGTFPNPFFCCGGNIFEAPSYLPRNINAPSDRPIGVIQFYSGSNAWPPKHRGKKAKFGGPIRPDFLWFPGQHPHFANEETCCGNNGGGYGRQSRPLINNNRLNAPGILPQGINPPSDSGGGPVQSPGNLPLGVEAPAGPQSPPFLKKL